MKKLILFLSLFLFIFTGSKAQSVATNTFNGRVSIQTVTNVVDSTWAITGYFSNSVQKYTASQIAVNDRFYVQVGANTYRGRVSVVNSPTGNLISIRIVCNLPNAPSGVAAILRETSNGYPVYVDGITNSLQAGIQNYLVNKLQSNISTGTVNQTTLNDSTAAIRSDFPTTLPPNGAAGGDLQGTYPNPTVKSNIINRANLTQTLRDSLLRFRKDTFITVTNSTLNLTAQANTLGKYNRVYVQANSFDSNSVTVVLPVADDTLKNTEFVVNHLSDDTTSALCTVYNLFDFFAVGYTSGGYSANAGVYLKDKRTLITKPFFVVDRWYWTRAIINGSNSAVFGDLSGMTSLTGDVTGSGTTAITTTIAANAVTSAKILDGTVSLADHASNSVNSAKIVDTSIALGDMASNSVNGSKVVDYSLTGADLDYLTLRAGDASNAILKFSNGTDKSSVTGGEWLFDGNRLGFAISTTKKRVPLTNDVAPTAGQIPVGNGTDYTVTALTAGYAQTVTNGSGSITILPDTTKVIPYIPSGEISNGTRDGYFRTTTSFGHQFYNNGFRIFNSSLATTSGATGLSVSNGTNDAAIQAQVAGSGIPKVETYVNYATTGRSGSIAVEPEGLYSPSIYHTISANTQLAATYAIDGVSSIEHITGNAVTAITLPEIVALGDPTLNQVCIGFVLYLSTDTATGITVNVSGSDVILVDGSASSVTSVSIPAGDIFARKLVAVGVNSWAVYR